jgi:UDP-N-acetylmuramoyl-L-alanyl-D-glutamate--2,6-diaminopimelate ligase
MTKSLDSWLTPFGVKAPKLVVKDAKTNSREIKPGDIFIAVAGVSQQGTKFISNAIDNGAIAVMTDSQTKVQPLSVPLIVVDDLIQRMPSLLGAFYSHGQQLKKIGITGTNGKTTVSQLIAQLGEMLAQKVSIIGTMGVGSLNSLVDINNTTPGLANNYRLLDEFARNGSQYVSMEVSSQGLDQKRTAGIDFDCTIFTNLTQDHLDYHGSFESYATAKRALFDDNPTAIAVLNIDDATAVSWLQQWRQSRAIIAVGQFDADYTDMEHVMFEQVEYTAQGLAFKLKSSWGNATVVTPLFGQFNLSNLVAAMAALLSFGFSLSDLVAAVAKLSAVTGRMERFGYQGISAIVDYAHTPDALSQVLQALKGHVEGRLWCVFGCGGDRDKTKRAMMGAIAEQFADKIVLTTDNPRHEDGLQIIDDIKAGIKNQEKVIVQWQRKQAIADTLAAANNGDIVLIAGKGHETYQVFGDDVIDYDERNYVRQCLRAMSEEVTS